MIIMIMIDYNHYDHGRLQVCVFRDHREFSGSLFQQLDEAFFFIDRYNRIRGEIRGLDRIDTRDYPPEAVREALLNAIVHREYSFSASTLISIFDDRIEFVTVGGLLKGFSLSDIMLGVSALRNPNLANVFFRLNLIEAHGTGMLKIQESYSTCEAKPGIELSDNAFRITLPNVNFPVSSGGKTVVRPLSEREKQVLALFDHTGPITRKDVEQAVGVSLATAIILLREMLEKNLIMITGNGKNLRYVLNN